MARTTYFRASIILVTMTVAVLVTVLATQKPAEAGWQPPPEGICLPGPGADCPPETEITSGPLQNGTVYADRVTFDFTGYDDKTATTNLKFECQLDGGAWETPCASPKEYTGLSAGSHTFQVRAKDSSGRIDATPASRTWRVDTTQPPPPDTSPPETTVTSWSWAHVTNKTTSFGFTGRDDRTAVADLRFECRMDGIPDSDWSVCTSPKEYTDVSDGYHTFQVRAIDSADNVDATPDSRRILFDASPPDTTITSNPTDPSHDSTPTFGFSMIDNAPLEAQAVSFFRCRYYPASASLEDWEGWEFCRSQHTLSQIPTSGTYTFEVVAYDGWHRPDPTPASYTWTYRDATAPSAPVITSPADNTFYADGNFIVSGTAENGSTVELFDGTSSLETVTANESGNWSVPLNGVTQGEHTYTARARDAAGNPSEHSNPLKVTVDGTAPTVDSTVPVPGARGVARGANVTATFSDYMNQSSLTTSAKLYQWNALKKIWRAVPASVSVDGKEATLDPYPTDSSRLLAANSRFKVTITTGAKNLTGLPLEIPRSWTFTTGRR
jgi:hypothetical protein